MARETPVVEADPYWLGRAVDELVDNALKFSPDGGRVSVSARKVVEDGRTFAEIAVRDAGVGMSREAVDQALAEWAQGDESDTRAYGGLGLGLPLVQRVAERHGGTVHFDTAPGKGTRVTVLLPAARPAAAERSRSESAGPAPRPSRPPSRPGSAPRPSRPPA